jgi:hypothetical protein
MPALSSRPGAAGDDRQPMEVSAGLRPRWAANQASGGQADVEAELAAAQVELLLVSSEQVHQQGAGVGPLKVFGDPPVARAVGLLPLPWANRTIPPPCGDRAKSPSRATPPTVIRTASSATGALLSSTALRRRSDHCLP